MTPGRTLIRATLVVLVMALSTSAWASPHHRRHGLPPAFDHDGASAIGQARRHYDRAQYERFRSNPGAQFELRQKRQNLCRNVPEMC